MSRLHPSPAVQRLIAMRGLRSLSQGYLNIVAPLYLLSVGVTATELGALVTASFLVGAALLVPVGIFADRYGRKPFLVAFTLLMAAWGTIYSTSTTIPLLLGISALAGIGRGGGFGGGQGGPFAPAEQALLADLVPAPLRHRTFALNAFVGAALAAAGAALAGLPGW